MKYIKFHIDKTSDSPLRRSFGKKGETVSHIISKCKKLAQKEYKHCHDNVACIVHWELCGAFQLKREEKWYEHKPESIMENKDVKLLCDCNIQCNHVKNHSQPNIVVVKKKEKECLIIDIAMLADNRVR